MDRIPEGTCCLDCYFLCQLLSFFFQPHDCNPLMFTLFLLLPPKMFFVFDLLASSQKRAKTHSWTHSLTCFIVFLFHRAVRNVSTKPLELHLNQPIAWRTPQCIFQKKKNLRLFLDQLAVLIWLFLRKHLEFT